MGFVVNWENMKCKICNSQAVFYTKKKILNKYVISLYRCQECSLIFSERPYWIKEAYILPIVDSDTGILSRNLALSRITTLVIIFFSKRNSKVLDYAGGYGILTRTLRDIGIDCYWLDKYAENIFAKGFEAKFNKKYDLVTSFELFEHLENPVKEIDKIVKRFKPRLLLFSTLLHNGTPPDDWWYFAPEGGQHITFYTKKSLRILADKIGMKFSTNGRNIHIFSKRYIPGLFLIMISVFWPIISIVFPLFFKSKTFSDHLKITASK